MVSNLTFIIQSHYVYIAVVELISAKTHVYASQSIIIHEKNFKKTLQIDMTNSSNLLFRNQTQVSWRQNSNVCLR